MRSKSVKSLISRSQLCANFEESKSSETKFAADGGTYNSSATQMLLTRKHEFWRVGVVAGIGFGVALSSVLWPFIRSAFFEQLRPLLGILDKMVFIVTLLFWSASVFAWFWVAKETWLMRSVFVCASLALWIGVGIVLSVTVGPLGLVMTVG
jgi:hypothetical protein